MPTSSLVFIRGAFRKLRCNEKICVAFTMRGGVAGAKVSATISSGICVRKTSAKAVTNITSRDANGPPN